MSSTLTGIISSLKYLAHRSDDDFIDRLHYFTTSNLLIALSVLVSFKQFGGRPVECMLPDYFPSSWEQYAENYCWAQDTYFLSFDVDVTRKTPRDYKISYYQWVPFFLLIEAACFRLPSLIWKYMAAHSGIRIHDIVRIAVDERNIQSEVKQSNVRALTVHLQNALRFHRRLMRKRITPHKIIRFLNLPYSALYVTFTYLLTKVLYLFNVWVQLLLLNRFLHTDKYSWYGWGVLSDLLSGTTWKQSGIFPRVTLCDFEVRGMGNLQNHTVQCVLVINIFNEKIFVFLWFWFTALTLLTTASLLYWLSVTIFPWPSRWFISRHLELSEMPFDPKGSAKDVERFVSGYLKTDGVFVLRMITMHSGIIFGTELVLSLWRSFYGIEEKIRRGDSDPAYLTPTPTTPGEDENILNTLRQRSLRKDKILARKKKKNDDEDIILKDLNFKEKDIDDDEEDEDDENAGITEFIVRGPKLDRRPRSAKVQPSAPPKSLDMPDSRIGKKIEISRKDPPSYRSGVRETKIDFGLDEMEDEDKNDENGDNSETSNTIVENQPHQQSRRQREEGASGSGRGKSATTQELEKYFAA